MLIKFMLIKKCILTLNLRNSRAKTFGQGYWALNVAFPKYFQATYKSLLKTTYDVISRDCTIVQKPELGESFFLRMGSLGNETVKLSFKANCDVMISDGRNLCW